jgi:hypothetical protein
VVLASIVLAGPAAPYRMFDVDDLDLHGARLRGPLLLEIGEEVTLRLSRGDAEAEVQARVTAVERGAGDPVSVLAFVGDDAGARVRAIVAG